MLFYKAKNFLVNVLKFFYLCIVNRLIKKFLKVPYRLFDLVTILQVKKKKPETIMTCPKSCSMTRPVFAFYSMILHENNIFGASSCLGFMTYY